MASLSNTLSSHYFQENINAYSRYKNGDIIHRVHRRTEGIMRKREIQEERLKRKIERRLKFEDTIKQRVSE
jgi:hypothetical protein